MSTENSSNIRRDITAETSLMNDLDKRVNYELESPQDARFNSRNVNLLISLNSDENLVGNNGAWCFHGSSKTNSDNASLERSGKHATSQLVNGMFTPQIQLSYTYYAYTNNQIVYESKIKPLSG